MTEHLTESKAFKYADNRIHSLLDKLRARGVCGCCTGRAMMFNATALCEQTMGSAGAVRVCEEIIATLRRRNVPVPDYEGEGRVIEDGSVH